ncbi:uncharacterized protein LOC117566460 [Drosophila albomicans]|uniref:Uncharacterized protein LOC117566460 n=1 Tax=Drosophila albomicans TaxID=7291 RepID=A0A9C6WHX2_DROAB|nr:uncharacterized protein LOC117566460 [Drosophila albomicans]
MHIQSIVALCLIICCAQISAQSVDCDKIYKSCTDCARNVPQRDEINHRNNCPREVEERWIWRNLSQCEIQRLYCQNPGRRFTCDTIAELAKMRRRITPRCIRCTTRRTSRRTTRRRSSTSRRPTTRRTSRRSTSRRTTRRTTRKPSP